MEFIVVAGAGDPSHGTHVVSVAYRPARPERVDRVEIVDVDPDLCDPTVGHVELKRLPRVEQAITSAGRCSEPGR